MIVRAAGNALLLASMAGVAIGQECAAPPTTCAPAVCAPPVCAPPPKAPAPKQQGRFVRAPAPGAAAGESNTLGIRGPVLHIPEIRIGLPHLELPGMYRIRHDAAKVFDTVRSPLLEEDVLEFDHVESAPRLEAPPTGPSPQCAPQYGAPMAPPCNAQTERLLREELLRKELEIEELNQRFARLEDMIARLAERQAPAAKPAVQPSSYEEMTPAELDPPPFRSTRTTSPPAASGRKPIVHDVEPQTALPANVGRSRIRDDVRRSAAPQFGDWNSLPRNVVDTREVRR